MILTFNKREVQVEDVEWEVGEGVYSMLAYFVDTGETLSETETQALLAKHHSEIYEDVYCSMAANAYDRAKDLRKYGE